MITETTMAAAQPTATTALTPMAIQRQRRGGAPFGGLPGAGGRADGAVGGVVVKLPALSKGRR